MNKDMMLAKYSIKKVVRKECHTVGSVQSFNHPSIAYIKEGRAEFLYKGKTVHAEKGDLVYISMHTQYYSVWFGSPDIEFYITDFAFSAPYLFYEYKFQIVKGFPQDAFDKMYASYKTAPFLSVSQLYAVLDRVYGVMSAEASPHKYTRIEPAIEYIEKNFAQPIDIRTLARLCRCSESALFKAFQAGLGISPIVYKHNVMIQHALDMLSHTDLSVEEISRRVGFASSNYFRKIFIKITGKTPKEIRKQNLK